MIIDPKEIESVPKSFCDGYLAGVNKDYFVIVLGSGESIDGFVFPPAFFKTVVRGMAQTLKIYEDKYGEIKETAQPILSPIQLAGPGDGLKDGDKIN